MSDLWSAAVTAVATLLASFGGFTLAARAQLRLAQRGDERAIREAERARSIALEDERHEFQLTTLIALQELTRRRARDVLLIIEQDRQMIGEFGGYRQLSSEDPEDFLKAIEFGHNVARVTSEDLRNILDTFSGTCAEYSLPPMEWKQIGKDKALALQEQRFLQMTQLASRTTQALNHELRRELDRSTM